MRVVNAYYPRVDHTIVVVVWVRASVGVLKAVEVFWVLWTLVEQVWYRVTVNVLGTTGIGAVHEPIQVIINSVGARHRYSGVLGRVVRVGGVGIIGGLGRIRYPVSICVGRLV